VVLTALARLVGWPARVVLGVVLVPQESTVRAFGHAWTEIHDGPSLAES
jgi:transglutaminase-like putative cysteine protease